MSNTTKTFPVIVTAITLTKPTMKLTGLDSFADFVEQKDTIFAEWSKEECIQVWDNIHKGKLLDEQIAEFEKKDVKKMQNAIYQALTLRVEIKQETVRLNKDGEIAETSVTNSLLSRNLLGRGNTLTITKPVKYAWMYPTVASLEAEEYMEGLNLSERFTDEYNSTIFIKRENSTTPKFDEKGNITSSPKRNGKNGDILLDINGKIIFQHTEIIEVEGDVAVKLQEEEIANLKQFKHDNVILSAEIPVESRATNGVNFNKEFQVWLNETYTAQEKGMVKVG